MLKAVLRVAMSNPLRFFNEKRYLKSWFATWSYGAEGANCVRLLPARQRRCHDCIRSACDSQAFPHLPHHRQAVPVPKHQPIQEQRWPPPKKCLLVFLLSSCLCFTFRWLRLFPAWKHVADERLSNIHRAHVVAAVCNRALNRLHFFRPHIR